MRVFITGASGYVGSVVSEKALKAGHTVRGLARSENSAKKLIDMGVTPVRGLLTDLDLLSEEAGKADAVLHLGFVHEFDRPYDQLVAIDKAAIRALGKGLAGTNKPLVTTSGTAVAAPDNGKETNEDSPLIDNPLKIRADSERTTIDLVKDGVRAVSIRLAPFVYGRGGSYFVPVIMQAAAKHGFVPYVGDGSIMTTTADVDAAADLYLLAMEHGAAGSIFNCSTETDVRYKDLAAAIGTALGLEARSGTREAATEFYGHFVGYILQLENRASNQKARRELGWQPHPKLGLLDDIVKGSYAQLAERLRKEVVASRQK